MQKTGQVPAETRVGNIIEAYPETVDIFLAHGIEPYQYRDKHLTELQIHPVDVRISPRGMGSAPGPACRGDTEPECCEWMCSLNHVDSLINDLKEVIG